MRMTVNRTELIQYLLLRDFGSLPPPISEDPKSVDWKLREASRQRDLRMKGLEDTRPAIERRRAEYQSLSDEKLQTIAQHAREEDEKQAESLRQLVEAVKAGAWLQWAKKDLWSEAELSALCCGLIPDERGMPADPGRTHADAVRILRANDDIRRGTLSGTLEFISRSDEDAASRMYGTARHYIPAVAVEWATPRFETFPQALLVAVRERARDIRGIAASTVSKWPWGDHETELLKKLAAAAGKFWTLYDRTDATTAPKNDVIVAWLKKQNVSERTAEVMATILRADGLPTGPRK